MNLIDKAFIRDPKHYLLQSLLAVVVIMIIFYFEVLPHIVIAISLGGSAFIVFTMPRSVSAQPYPLYPLPFISRGVTVF
ncbi:hypothetical protein ES703_124473 [subsurface metagenome]